LQHGLNLVELVLQGGDLFFGCFDLVDAGHDSSGSVAKSVPVSSYVDWYTTS
jgi:hypothetical protein